MPLNDLCPLRHNIFFSSLYNPECLQSVHLYLWVQAEKLCTSKDFFAGAGPKVRNLHSEKKTRSALCCAPRVLY